MITIAKITTPIIVSTNFRFSTSFEVIADEVSFCGSKADKPQTPNNDDFEEIPISDDLPF